MNKRDLIDALRNEIMNLKESPLYDYRTTNGFLPVIGEGSLDARIMLVGEAPGRNEAKTGKPFCGAAGKVLDKLLAHIKLTRDQIYITNIVNDRPPENRDPTKKEIEIYGPFLDKQIKIIKPQVIVSLGRYAMAYIMTKFGLNSQLETIGKAHGKIYHASSNSGLISIITLYHPCMAVYNPNNLGSLKKDFEILRDYV